MSQPHQINPARASALPETRLQAFDRSQRGRRFADLDAKRRYAPLKLLERDTWRTLLAERRLAEREDEAAERARAGTNVRRMPGGAA